MSTDIAGKIVKGPSGRHLGWATGESATRFCVDVDGESVWLPRDAVFSVEADEVTVIFEPSGVGRYALEGRGGGERSA